MVYQLVDSENHIFVFLQFYFFILRLPMKHRKFYRTFFFFPLPLCYFNYVYIKYRDFLNRWQYKSTYWKEIRATV